ncbi:putative nuclease HARBI1 [Acyrthosiphon pisum]|uniref:Putative nuclease HARBI1 n=1 Tax=Acyrthosiphon pisum TaxID=7029 RepID=A0A8R2F9R7_ACYPI|nr:putative nuclease HARBI1 [Acyrthosiphon pisum]|eukprot:XP_008185268.1 PREDICTED: putative nuclease HARBI1 [Acyrthosiphon pisum]
MSLVEKPHIKDYWSTNPVLQTTYASKIMKRDRFISIFSMLHIANNDKYVRKGQPGSSEDASDFDQLIVMIAFPRNPRIFRPRKHHFTYWRDDEFFNRFRLSKNTVRYIVDIIGDRICSRTDWNNAVSPEDKVLLTLRYYATGSMLILCGDFIGIHKSTASRIVKLVSHNIAILRPQFVNFPNNENDLKKVKQDFYNIAKFPTVIGALDCTHVKIKSPGGDNAEVYRNRKNFFSINVQTICDANLKIQDIVARWPGSSHDSTIFNNSEIRRKLEIGEMRDCVLVADSGYAQRNYVMTGWKP